MAATVLKLDRDGWAVFVGACGELHIGNVRKVGGQYEIEDIWTTCPDTPANRVKAVGIWKANSFTREVKA